MTKPPPTTAQLIATFRATADNEQAARFAAALGKAGGGK